MTFSMGLLYDTHLNNGRKGFNGVATTRAAIDKLNDVGVDFTLHGGDTRPLSPLTSPDQVDWGTWNEGEDPYYPKEFAIAKQMLDNRLDSDYYLIRGNHDRPVGVLREYFPPEDATPPTDLGNDHNYFGVEERDGVRLVYLNTSKSQGYHAVNQIETFISSQQLSMLDRIMDADPEMPTLVFTHALLTTHTELEPGDWMEPKGQSYERVQNRASVRARLERGNTLMSNAGHYYGDIGRGSKTVNGIEYVLARHLTHTGDANYGGDVRWLEVDTDARTVTCHYYDVGSDQEGVITSVSWSPVLG